MAHLKHIAHLTQVALQVTAMAFFSLTAVASIGFSILAFTGLQTWPVLFSGPNGLVITQSAILGAALLSVSLLAYLPSSKRVLTLENSHRQFEVRMNDVARAYWQAHAADREGLFNAQSEFDAVRERMVHLREHPDLAALEPEILELAAQMSQTSQELANTYSDQNVARAKSFLEQRQRETLRLEELMEQARTAHGELSGWYDRVALDEDIAETQATHLIDDMKDLIEQIEQRIMLSRHTPRNAMPLTQYAAE